MQIPEGLRGVRVAIVHDYLNQPGGAEKVVETFAEMFPGAPIYTSVYDPDAMPDVWRTLDVRTSFMQRISPRMRISKALLPLYPTAFESFDLREYDLVLSSTTTFAKGVITRPETCHVCYCNNPTRFLWMYHSYLEYEHMPAVALKILPWVATRLRVWDFAAAQRVDYFIAGSHNASRRIAKFYRRDSEVLQPPVDVGALTASPGHGDYFLVASRLQPYKRIDLAVQACTQLELPLHVLGDGPDRRRLENMAGPTVKFSGHVSDDEVRRKLATCLALIFPGEEDFGMTPVEAQASGRPVIAFSAGGALETVVEGETGRFFREPTVESLAEVLRSFEDTFDRAALRASAERFDKHAFVEKLYSLLETRLSEHRLKFAPALPSDVPTHAKVESRL
jgi:glycosyltransferase involved in cell wall biosynthesis